ncbi:hypothetical protein MYX78_14000, partial [Acidobacteria bacterium AH-259-G07]|nr:hypothetical protein [Acidobacteria bacterium AH-259-G07]
MSHHTLELIHRGTKNVGFHQIHKGQHQWLDQRYHRRLHTGIGERPLERYMRSLARIQPCLPTPQELDQVFYRTLSRKVREDSTVSIAGALWELPPAYIGQRVEIRHPQGRPQELYVFEEDRP